MKKFGLTIAMATILTIGGVYATFNYAQGGVTNVDETLNVTIEGVKLDTPKGKINLTNNNYKITIANKNDGTNAEYENFTKLETEGNFTVSFTPAAGADKDVIENGIVLEMTIGFTGNDYDGGPIFTTNTNNTNNKVTLKDGNKIKDDYTFDLDNYISIKEYHLSTYADYTAYKEALNKTSIIITIGEYKAQ